MDSSPGERGLPRREAHAKRSFTITQRTNRHVPGLDTIEEVGHLGCEKVIPLEFLRRRRDGPAMSAFKNRHTTRVIPSNNAFAADNRQTVFRRMLHIVKSQRTYCSALELE